MARFYLDNDVAQRVAAELDAFGHDAITTRALHRRRARDEQQLMFAVHERRIFVTHNARDFILLHDAWHLWTYTWGVQEEHTGIFIPPQDPTSWPAPKIALEIHLFIKTGQPIANQLYEWDQGAWVRR